ncbi:ImmA/IrrE family metallo-endopeptidase [Methylocella sp. CPCC 101449]|uniref:ImmA/IrrE family metallo-endopeptidase n=1 Tax=Methylocella sp. CPCC 101449 TaxID=2987531 RepID=UPI00288DC005|nr:ImmA/IrrE family metallo-endopeptidase [Methylocella sp. CPCC 101449]MDT2020780.1 ImmA/IrrE family metallo-endopeptidase [Methylocella sp. CPCC 101449]HEV2574280.1 ImmA/IrrE family metallo-endopeptidase [Beijerinckiaceae bacterium]
MPSEQIPITPAIVTWARKRAGFALADMEREFPKIAQWEVGDSYPTYRQLENLSVKLKVPVAVFFFPEEPRTPPIEETFRTLPQAVLDRLPSRMKLLLRKAKALQLNLIELCGGRNPMPRLITRDLRFSPAESVVTMAREVREYLGISIDQQIAWLNDDSALKAWRDSLQKFGVFIFKDAFQAADYSGFCLVDNEFPIIYLNNSCSKTRQMFTIFHELAHLLFETSGIDSLSEIEARPGQSRQIEVFCNRFAAEFLLPAAVFEQARRGLAASEETAQLLAARFHVSRESIFRRFLDRREISLRQYEEAAERWNNEGGEGAGGNYYNTKLAYLPRDYVALALAAYHQNRISEGKLAEFLDTKPRNLSTLEERFIGNAAA